MKTVNETCSGGGVKGGRQKVTPANPDNCFRSFRLLFIEVKVRNSGTIVGVQISTAGK